MSNASFKVDITNIVDLNVVLAMFHLLAKSIKLKKTPAEYDFACIRDF